MTLGDVSAQNATFTTQQYPILGNTHIAADFNGDSRPDLAGAGVPNAASVMLGNGDGTFGARTDFPVGFQTQAVAAGDFNSDGNVDLAVTLNSPQFSLALLNGTGTGSFNAPTYFPNTSGFDSPAIAATDLNGDGRLDLVVMHTIACFTAPCTVAQSITILLGNGNGTFQTPSEIGVGTVPQVMAVGDFNGDGIKDVAIGGRNTEFSVLLGVGDGTFVWQPVVTLVPGGDPFSICNDMAVGDLNRDGIQDLVVPLGNGRGNAILIGNGNGTFQVTSRIQIDETWFPLHVAVADYNRDGLLDIARTMGDGSNGLMQILNGNGDGTFRAPVRYLVPPPNSSIGGIVIIAGDWNGDGKPDVAFVVGGATAALDVLTNTTGGGGGGVSLSSLTLNPATVTGGNPSTGTATLSGPAPAGGQVVTLSSGNTAVASVPASVTVASGATSATFTVTTTAPAAQTIVTITGSSGGATRTANLTVNPVGGGAPGFKSPSANAADSGGDGNGFESNPGNAQADDAAFAADNNSGTGTGTSCTSSGKDRHRFFNYGFAIPTGSSINGIEVRLDARADSTSSSPKMCVQLSWDGGTTWTAAKPTGTLGTTMATFTLGSATDTWGRTWSASNLADSSFRVRVIDVSSSTSRDFFLDWVAVRPHFTVPGPASLSGMSVSPSTVVGGNPSTGTVTLTSAAPSGGAVVSLSSSNTSAATVPASVTVAAGAASANFTVTTQSVGASTPVTISASYASATKTTTLTVNPQATGDTVAIQRAEYDDRDEELRVEATSTSSSATLQVFVTSTNQLIGTLTNNGGGRYSRTFSWPTNPQNITVRSSLVGSASRNVTLN